MKTIYDFIKEEGAPVGSATPGNTIGMGNPLPAGSDGEIGSDPIPTAKLKRRRKKSLKESLLDDEEDLIDNNDSIIEIFLKDNYIIKGSYVIKNGIVDINGDIILKNDNIEHLTDRLFNFGKVTGDFIAGEHRELKNIKSLEGAPRIVNNFIFARSSISSLKGGPEIANDYDIHYNDKLINLEGAPKILKGSFRCYGCDNLISLKGCPEEIGWNFDCGDCDKLTNLKGGPKIVGNDYDCFQCPNLKSLKGIAKKIGGTLDCSDCYKLPKEEAKKELINVKYKELLWL